MNTIITNKDQYIKEATKYFHQRMHRDPNQSYNLYWVTIRPNLKWMKSVSTYTQRRVLIEDLTYSLIKKVERHLFKNPDRPCNSHKRIDSRNVIETKDRYGNPDDHHQHGIWMVNQEFFYAFNDNLFEKIIRKGNYLKTPLRHVIQSIDIQGIPTSTQNLFRQWCDDLTPTLDYMFKHCGDQRNSDWCTPWSYF